MGCVSAVPITTCTGEETVLPFTGLHIFVAGLVAGVHCADAKSETNRKLTNRRSAARKRNIAKGLGLEKLLRSSCLQLSYHSKLLARDARFQPFNSQFQLV